MTNAAKAVLAAALCTVAACTNAATEPLALEASVVHVRHARVYVVARDSATIVVGDLLTLSARGKTVATATVTAVAGELAGATLTSGSLDRVKKLERLQVTRERPEPHGPGTLRIGYPIGGRDNLLVACGRWSPATFEAAGFRPDSLGPRSFRLTRASSAAAAVPWPDTLQVRLFEESVDEEIAFERGELDVAVFWPGELSSHLRDHPRFLTALHGSRGALVAAISGEATGELGALAAADDAALEAMNASLFRGDLARLNEPPRANAMPPATRFDVDGGIPRRSAIANILNRGRPLPGTPGGLRVRLAFFDAPARAADLTDAVLFSARFEVRCPIVCTPALRGSVGALADALARFTCRP